MSKKLTQCLIVLLSLCFASELLAVTDEEIFRAFSLNLSTPGARARAMGGAFIGRADDATAAETNPAGLTVLVKPEVSFEVRHANSRTISTSVVAIPTTPGYDLTPTCVGLNPDPGGNDNCDDPVGSEFRASDHQRDVTELGFFSVVYPIDRVSFAFSRHELINTDATLSGSVSASPFHFVEPNSFEGNATISNTNYGFSLAGKLSDQISIGGSLKVADFSFQSRITARQKDQPFFGDHFTTSINEDDVKIGFTGGILVRPHSKVSIGGVYRYEPEFDLTAVVENTDFHPNPLIISRDGENAVQFDIPDSVGVGVSIAPTKNWTFNADVVRVFYSQLESVDTGYSLFTHLLPIIDNADQVSFAIDDGTDIHAGFEYLVPTSTTTWAIRGGYYHETRNRFYLASAANRDIRAFLEPIFGNNPGNDLAHWTVGAGFTRGGFQLDFAVDLTQEDDVDEGTKQEILDGGVDYILSSVFRF